MSDLAADPTTRTRSAGDPSPHAESWQAKADPELDYSGGSGGEETPPPSGDTDQPGDPPPVADQEFSGGSGGEETPPPSGDTDMPGDPPPPEVAETNGR